MLGIAPMRGIRHHHGRKNSQLLDDCSRFVQSTQMCVTGGEKAAGRNPAWLLLQRREQHRPCSIRLMRSGSTALATGRVERKLAAILAADVVGYSRLMGVDEEGTLAAKGASPRTD
jgi:hypothetical protein